MLSSTAAMARWPLFILALLAVTGGTWTILVLLLVRARLYPPRLTPLRALLLLGRSGPEDLGFHPETLNFEVPYRHRDVQICSSLIRHPLADGRLVVVLHGFADSRAGACAWLPLLHGLKTNVLLLDLPGHGESGDAPCTAGCLERFAVLNVLEQFRAQRPDLSRRVVLFGISMGGAVALATALLPDSRVDGVVLDSPYTDFRKATVRHADLFGLPGEVVQRPAAWLIERMLGIDYDEVSPMRMLGRGPCPVLLIQSGDDHLISREDAAEMHEMVQTRSDGIGRAVTIPRAPHILALPTDPEAYGQAVRQFLSLVLP